jgi:DNA invertase Pin-like site-specific DNA recombinase
MNTTKNPTIVDLRVSTAEQETDSQEHQVLGYCKVRGWQTPLILRDACRVFARFRPAADQRGS